MSINTSLFPGNAWTYVNLASPIVLAAGQTYYIYRFTSSTTPDEFYQASSVTTTTDATLVGSLYSYDEQNWTVATDGKEFSLCDFQYSITTTLATIPGSPFVPLGRQLLPMFVGAPLSIVSGTITLDVSRIDAFGFGGVPTPVNTVVVQYWLDGQPFGPQILGPLEDTGNQNLPHWPLALDTTKLTDGTHVVFPQVVDTRSGGYASAAFYMAYSQQLIVANNGLNNGAQTIPLSPNPRYPISLVKNEPKLAFNIRSAVDRRTERMALERRELYDRQLPSRDFLK